MRRRLAVALSGAVAASGLALAPASAAPARGTAVVCPADRLPPLPYVDVREGASGAREVACALGLQLVRGRTSTVFDPASPITRGNAALLLVRAAALTGTELPRGTRRFSDMNGAPPEVDDAVHRLAEAGVVSGYGDGTFRPQLGVPRDQAASMLLRLQRVVRGPVPLPEDCFDDVDGNVHREAVERLCALGVVQGSGDRQYVPSQVLSRTQLAMTLVRLLDVDAEAGLVRPLPPVPAYGGTAFAITATEAADMPSHRAGCPVPLSDLRRLEVRHWGFDGSTHVGELVVHVDAAQAVVDAFGRIYAARVVIERVRPVDEYGADDDASMAANNTSAYNCRTVTGGTSWSQHAYGRAIDVNPVQNPYVTSRTVAPAAGRAYLDRSDVRPGMAVSGGPIVAAFTASRWGWGGTWTSAKDYQHFSSNGR